MKGSSMRIQINTNNNTLIIDNKKYKIEPYKQNLADIFELYLGVKEYNGIVADIQRWYYGSLVKAPWCATSMSFFANELGILSQFGGKNENVYRMLKCNQIASNNRVFTGSAIPTNIERGDVLYYNWSPGEMSTNSNKHVCVCFESTADDLIKCIGGNQNDGIMIKTYHRAALYALFRPEY